MAMTSTELLAVQRERLRALTTLLEIVPKGRRRGELLQLTRVVIADVREARRRSTAQTVAAVEDTASHVVPSR